MWLVVVVGRCLERCEHYEDFCSTRHVEIDVNNKHLIVASCWFFSLHALLTMHGHRNLKHVVLCLLYSTTLHQMCAQEFITWNKRIIVNVVCALCYGTVTMAGCNIKEK